MAAAAARPKQNKKQAGGSLLKMTTAPADIAKVHTLLGSNDAFLLVVMAEWCSHCRRLKDNHWPAFVAASENKINMVELDYTTYGDLIKEKSNLKDCLFSKLLKKSVHSFPYVALVQKSSAAVNVRLYDGDYPITSATLATFCGI